jgi:hypothetical protein
MKFRIGYEFKYVFPQPTPCRLMLKVHRTRASDLVMPDQILTRPSTPISGYYDLFGNLCSRIVAPAGDKSISADTIIRDSGQPDPVDSGAAQLPVEHLCSPADFARATGLSTSAGSCSARPLRVARAFDQSASLSTNE